MPRFWEGVGNTEVTAEESAPSHHRRLPRGSGRALRTALTERICHSHPAAHRRSGHPPENQRQERSKDFRTYYHGTVRPR
jgi:hypothetical protein